MKKRGKDKIIHNSTTQQNPQEDATSGSEWETRGSDHSSPSGEGVPGYCLQKGGKNFASKEPASHKLDGIWPFQIAVGFLLQGDASLKGDKNPYQRIWVWHDLEQGSANFFHKGLDSKYFWLWAKRSLSQLLNSVTVIWKHPRQYVNEWVWPCANKTLFTKTCDRGLPWWRSD